VIRGCVIEGDERGEEGQGCGMHGVWDQDAVLPLEKWVQRYVLLGTADILLILIHIGRLYAWKMIVGREIATCGLYQSCVWAST